ncbi:MAG TPA: hypothetical protein VM553_06040 [Dongiaceae bacterium]|nr:hypothetical protein [Dongiaceae bacterium]
MSVFSRLGLLFTLFFTLSCSAAADVDFQSFWTQFRKAALASDYTALEKMSKMPLEVKGVDDSMPSQQLDSAKLKQVFPALLAQKIYRYEGDELSELTLRQVLEQTSSVKAQADAKDARVEQFEFAKTDGQWRLIRAYLEE